MNPHQSLYDNLNGQLFAPARRCVNICRVVKQFTVQIYRVVNSGEKTSVNVSVVVVVVVVVEKEQVVLTHRSL